MLAIKQRAHLCRLALIAVIALSSPAIGSETIEYTYDARGRLIEVKRIQPSGNVKTKYEYDGADNRTKKEVTPVP